MMSRAAKSLYRQYYGKWPKSRRYGPCPITAQPKAMLSFVVCTGLGVSGAPVTTTGWKCGPLPASSGHKR